MSVSVIVPAYQAADRVAATVAGARQVAGVAEVIVVDDGSRDGTAEAARVAGADQVIVLPHNRGKGHALRAGVAAAAGDTLLFLDSDLGETAARAGVLLDAIAGRQAMSIAVLPSHGHGGGFGLAKGLAAAVIRLFTGLRVSAPLSGQRAIPAAVVRRIGLAPRWAVEVALTCEAAHLGIPIIEVPVDFEHRHTGRDVAGFGHRFRQFADVLRYALLAGYGLGWPALTRQEAVMRLLCWSAGFALSMNLWVPLRLPGLVLLTITAGVSLVLWLPFLWVSAVVLGSRKTNYLGRLLPGAAGLIVPVTVLLAVWLNRDFLPFAAPLAAVAVGFGSVGLLDDLYGHLGRARGLRGHLRALRRGQFTTGAVKALGGLATALLAASLLPSDRSRPDLLILDALVIALTANLLNLLDLRPGRALKGFLALALLALVLRPSLLALLGPALAATLVLAPSDLSGRAMLGDVGANTLGGVAGLMLAMALTPTPLGRLIAVLLLLAIHVYCERASLTDLIARHRVLRSLDQLGTQHLPPLEEEA
jgi:hypothetical protein